jgi:hypothetical protein
MEQPIDCVHRIYDYFGLAWSAEFEKAMRTWLNNNPQGKQGRNSYALDEFGLSAEQISQQYAEYTRLFLSTGTDKCTSEHQDDRKCV